MQMSPTVIQAYKIEPGDTIIWDSKLVFIESVDRSFHGAVKIKHHESSFMLSFSPEQYIIRFSVLPTGKIHEIGNKHLQMVESMPTMLDGDEIKEFITEIDRAGRVTEDVRERNQLRALGIYWCAIAYDKLGYMPKNRIEPYIDVSS